MNTKLFFVIPVHNEEGNLNRCINSLYSSIKNIKCKFNTFICLNDCSDSSYKIAVNCKGRYRILNIQILESKKGKFNAQKTAIKKIPRNSPIFFIDADIILKKDSIEILIKELDKHPDLIAVGSFPVARDYKGKKIWKIFLDKVLNIRSRHPQCEISLLEVNDYHPYSISDPQHKNASPEHELKSKIFFHGRAFVLRSKKYWSIPKSEQIVGDDSFIPDYITFNYGKGRIRNRYDSIVYYNPFISITKHFKVYKRIYFDLKNLREKYPKFKNIRDHSQLILDKNYIKKQNVSTKILFFLYSFIRKIETLLYKCSKNTNPADIWK